MESTHTTEEIPSDIIYDWFTTLEDIPDFPPEIKNKLENLLTQYPNIINVRNSGGDTALYYAIWRDNPVFVEFLLAKGASTNIKNNKDDTPFSYATKNEKNKAAEVLKRHLSGGRRKSRKSKKSKKSKKSRKTKRRKTRKH